MKDKKLPFNRKCHVLYSKSCKKEIRTKIALHYPEAERETVWEKVQRQYAAFLSDWRTDLGGKRNFHNGVGGTYDCIAIMSYYTVCKAVTSFREIEEMEENLILPSFRRLRFVDCNKPFWQLLIILSVMNLIDRFLIDDYWVGHTKAWTIPGTEDLKPYISAAAKRRKWLFGTLGMALIAAALSGIMALIL